MINIEDVKTLTLQPGQTLVVQIEKAYPSSALEQLRGQFEGVFPDNRVLIIDKRIQLMVIDEEPTN